ncbi:PadR family transcriptional regulator [Kallotenue papyrolyticum]|uniref:PadR family transcriptional regulator n=1 Tax=Kallotenue papyrolyticum TaxID=1325125 RepID=UPI000694A41C
MSWSTELRKGILELCVLAILDREECYGYELVQRLQAYGKLLAGEGTIYPLLARLQRQGLVETSWRESHSGPPRKYYRLSEAGHQLLLELVDEWKSLRDSVDKLLGFAHLIK